MVFWKHGWYRWRVWHDTLAWAVAAHTFPLPMFLLPTSNVSFHVGVHSHFSRMLDILATHDRVLRIDITITRFPSITFIFCLWTVLFFSLSLFLVHHLFTDSPNRRARQPTRGETCWFGFAGACMWLDYDDRNMGISRFPLHVLFKSRVDCSVPLHWWYVFTNIML
jgi:hypothetical protein